MQRNKIKCTCASCKGVNDFTAIDYLSGKLHCVIFGKLVDKNGLCSNWKFFGD